MAQFSCKYVFSLEGSPLLPPSMPRRRHGIEHEGIIDYLETIFTSLELELESLSQINIFIVCK